MSDELSRIANALERIADFYERGLHVDIDHAHIDDIGEIHGDVVTHPKQPCSGPVIVGTAVQHALPCRYH